jgi:hypothetical protein
MKKGRHLYVPLLPRKDKVSHSYHAMYKNFRVTHNDIHCCGAFPSIYEGRAQHLESPGANRYEVT